MHADEVRAGLGEDADQAGADQPARDDQRDHEPVERNRELLAELVEALVDEADLELAVAEVVEDVVRQLRQRLESDLRELPSVSRGPPASIRRGVYRPSSRLRA